MYSYLYHSSSSASVVLVLVTPLKIGCVAALPLAWPAVVHRVCQESAQCARTSRIDIKYVVGPWIGSTRSP